MVNWVVPGASRRCCRTTARSACEPKSIDVVVLVRL
jgi:hypothetical protein